METTTMDNTQRIRTMICTIDTYLNDYTEQSDTDKIDTLMECVGCLSAALESLHHKLMEKTHEKK